MQLIPKTSISSLRPKSRSYYLFGLTITSEFPFVTPLLPATGTADLTFICTSELPSPLCSESVSQSSSSRARTHENEPFVRHYCLDECDVLRFTGAIEFYLWPNRIVCYRPDPSLDCLVELYLLGTVLAIWLERRATIALHAASVIVADRAVAFVASKGSGKSSLAAAFVQGGASLLTDDLLPIRVHGMHYLGQPGFPQMRMWPEQAQRFLGYYETLETVHPTYSKRRVPVRDIGSFCHTPRSLAAVYLLQRRPVRPDTVIEITPLSRPEALVVLLLHCFAGQLLNALGYQHFRATLLAPMARHIPVRQVIYPSGFEHLSKLRDMIVDDVETLARDM